MLASWIDEVARILPESMLMSGDAHGQRWNGAVESATSVTADRRAERLGLIMEWMWSAVGWRWRDWVPSSAHTAWEQMLDERTTTSAAQAYRSVSGAIVAASVADYAARAAHVANIAASAATGFAVEHGVAVVARPKTARDFERVVEDAVYAVDAAANAAITVVIGGVEGFWRFVDPARLLDQMTRVGPADCDDEAAA